MLSQHHAPVADAIAFEQDNYAHLTVDVPSTSFLDTIIASEESKRLEASTRAANLRREIGALAKFAQQAKKDAIRQRLEWKRRQESKASETEYHNRWGANSDYARENRAARKRRRNTRHICPWCGDPECSYGRDEESDEYDV